MKIDIVGCDEHTWNTAVPDHARIHGAVIEVIGGSGIISVNGTEHRVAAGTIVLYLPREEHGYVPDPGTTLSARMVRFALGHDAQSHEMVGRIGATRRFESDESTEALLQLAVRLSGSPLENEVQAGERALAALFSLFHAQVDPAPAVPRTTAIDAAMEHLYTSPDITLGQAADRFGVSAEAIRSQFRRHFNDSPMHYFSVYHIKRVAVALRTGEQSLRELSERFGYCDEYHLSRVFKRHLGVSPAEYRRLHKPSDH